MSRAARGETGFILHRSAAKSSSLTAYLTRLHDRERFASFAIDLARDHWPFAPGTLGGIIDVHFLQTSLFPHFVESLVPEAYLLLETVPGYGNNYLELPKAVSLRSSCSGTFTQTAIGMHNCHLWGQIRL